MNRHGIKTNYFIQTIYYILMLALSLLISPVITRRLGDTALGTFTYVSSIVYYFTLIANLGISRYGQRIISVARNDSLKLRKTFWSLYFCHFVVSVLSIALYLLFLAFFVHGDRIIYQIEMIFIVAALFDISWLFYGMEDFTTVIIVNLTERLLIFILILVLIHSPADLWIYTLLETLILLIGNVFLVLFAMKNIPFVPFEMKDCIDHIRPLFVLSASLFAVAAYNVFDRTLLGILSTKENVAYYEYANKIINIPKNFISIICSVIYPRACEMANKKDLKGQQTYCDLAFFSVCIIGFAAALGLSAISDQFSVLYLGESFAACGGIIRAMTPLILLVGFGEILRSIFLIPMNNDGVYLLMTCFCAFVSLFLSALLIPSLDVYGSVIGKIGAEISFLILLLLFCRKYIDFRYLFKVILVHLGISLIMMLTVSLCGNIGNGLLWNTILKILVGVCVYLCLALLTTRFFFTDVWNLLKNYIHHDLADKIKRKREHET